MSKKISKLFFCFFIFLNSAKLLPATNSTSLLLACAVSCSQGQQAHKPCPCLQKSVFKSPFFSQEPSSTRLRQGRKRLGERDPFIPRSRLAYQRESKLAVIKEDECLSFENEESSLRKKHKRVEQRYGQKSLHEQKQNTGDSFRIGTVPQNGIKVIHRKRKKEESGRKEEKRREKSKKSVSWRIFLENESYVIARLPHDLERKLETDQPVQEEEDVDLERFYLVEGSHEAQNLQRLLQELDLYDLDSSEEFPFLSDEKGEGFEQLELPSEESCWQKKEEVEKLRLKLADSQQ